MGKLGVEDLNIGLISYPRCGSNWVTFCIESVTRIKSKGSTHDFTIYCRGDNIEYIDGYSLIKSHWFNFEMDKLVYVIRNYKECIARDTICEATVLKSMNQYIDLLTEYDNFDKPKCIVHYEDLITNSKENILRVCNFIKDNDEKDIEEFFNNFEKYRTKSLSKYGNKTNGLTAVHHSNKLKEELKLRLDDIAKKHEILYDKYLKRYVD